MSLIKFGKTRCFTRTNVLNYGNTRVFVIKGGFLEIAYKKLETLTTEILFKISHEHGMIRHIIVKLLK